MPRDKAVDKVLTYYATLVGAACTISDFRQIAAASLVQSTPIDVASEPVEVLALLLHARQIKVCFYCHKPQPYGDFRSLGSKACAACRAPANCGYQQRWQKRNLERRRRYMEDYRSKKNGTFL
jgi:hypothetical protein